MCVCFAIQSNIAGVDDISIPEVRILQALFAALHYLLQKFEYTEIVKWMTRYQMLITHLIIDFVHYFRPCLECKKALQVVLQVH